MTGVFELTAENREGGTITLFGVSKNNVLRVFDKQFDRQDYTIFVKNLKTNAHWIIKKGFKYYKPKEGSHKRGKYDY